MPDNQHAILLNEPELEVRILDLQDGSQIITQLRAEFTVPYFVAFSPVSEDTIWVAGYPNHNLPINGMARSCTTTMLATALNSEFREVGLCGHLMEIM